MAIRIYRVRLFNPQTREELADHYSPIPIKRVDNRSSPDYVDRDMISEFLSEFSDKVSFSIAEDPTIYEYEEDVELKYDQMPVTFRDWTEYMYANQKYLLRSQEELTLNIGDKEEMEENANWWKPLDDTSDTPPEEWYRRFRGEAQKLILDLQKKGFKKEARMLLTAIRR